MTDAQDHVDRLLHEAFTLGASDLYLIPQREHHLIRVRVRGLQRDHSTVATDLGERCVTRIKVMASLLTYRTLTAQDGVIRLSIEGKACEFRVAVMPTLHGERVTLRLRSAALGPLRLDDLGFSPAIVTGLRNILAQPHGMLVLTGPTGCGKTTTIYALIRELLEQKLDPSSIITLEDPIESEIPGISQVAIREADQWGYAAGLRAALRQDMKTLVVGEMRDADIVGMTLDAALTGHRIITTYHAGDIPSVYARLLHQGFEPFLVASAITGVLTQRLMPAKDGRGSRPVAALLQPDDTWRDFVSGRPSLAELRARIRTIPAATLENA